IKQHARQAVETSYRTKILFETNQLLQKEMEPEEISSVTANQLTKLLKRDVVFYMVDDEDRLLEPRVFFAEEKERQEDYMTDNERAVAAWVCKNNKHAGANTSTLGSAKCMYLSVRVNDWVYGVVGIAAQGKPLDSFEHSIVLSILGECALALENDMAFREREEAAILAKNEQLRANLLRSISHDLRTPLTAISGNAGILMAGEEVMEKEKKKAIYRDIYDDSLWLINLVENLLSVTKIEDGSMSIKMTTELMEEIITEALAHLHRKEVEQKIVVEQPEDFVLAKMDGKLIMQVIINIVGNAIKYTPKDAVITIKTIKEEGQAVVEISDTGEGIADQDKEKIFDMFYTANNSMGDSRRSLGLGLALCKSIVNAHGGEIAVLDNHPKGTVFRFTLPAEEVQPYEE
ncbi:MAG: ATP-binding protein, partial [Anaerovoracaceae bacterium]